MDVLRNIKSMTATQFCNLQIFELIYLLVLAFLPFIVAIREVTYIILVILAFLAAGALFRQCTNRLVDPKDRVVLITGCDSGFGNTCARRFDSYGFSVVAGCYDETSDGANSLKEETSGQLNVIKLDITDEKSVKNCVAKVKALCGNRGLWALINNAGVSSFGDVEFSALDSYQRVMNVNVFGTVRITKAFLPLIRTAKGRLITMSGSTGQLSLPGQSAFCISNFALEAFSDALRLEVKPFGVKVITIRPGNFIGSTGILNRSGLDKLRKHLEAMKKEANPDVLSAYGQNYLDQQYNKFYKLSKSSANSLTGVMNALEKSVCSHQIKSQYLVDGGNQLLDLGNTLIRIRPFLPCTLFDCLVSKLFGSKPQVQ